MTALVVETFLLLFYFDLMMRFCSFKTVCSTVKGGRIDHRSYRNRDRIAQCCRAVDIACAFYFRQVHCLQRSAATTVLLRRQGFEASMVIGTQIIPFRSHAWVEVDEAIVNDKPYMSEIYKVLERC